MFKVRQRSIAASFRTCRMAAFAVAACASSVALSAQQASQTIVSTTATSHASAPLVAEFTMQPLNLADVAGVNHSSSSSSAEVTLSEPERLSLASEAMQPPPRRRRYGRPRYSDKMHNPDGSNKIAFVAGGGFAQPTGHTGKINNLSYSFKAGAGINFNKKLAIVGEYNYDHLGFQGRVLSNQIAFYKSIFPGATDGNGNTVNFNQLDGSVHLWSATLNPTYTFHQTDTTSAYIVVGGGFYRKVAEFTLPTINFTYDYFGNLVPYRSNQTFDHFSNNAGGVNGGIGFTYKLSRFSTERIFAEARYVEVFNSPSSNSVRSNFPPTNSRTGYIPVTVGLRF